MNALSHRPVLGKLSKALLAISLAGWVFAGPSAMAKGGGGGGGGHGGGGGGHGGGGHSGSSGHSGGSSGGHSGGNSGGGYHGGPTNHYHPGGGSYGGSSGFYFPGLYLGGYGFGYGNGSAYPYTYGYGSGYAYPSYTYQPNDLDPAASGNNVYVDPNASGPLPNLTQPSGVQAPMLGIDEETVVDVAGAGVRVDRVYPGSAAERAGLQAGDVILSANGYLTQVHGNLSWIINNHAPDGVLNLVVHRPGYAGSFTIVAQLP